MNWHGSRSTWRIRLARILSLLVALPHLTACSGFAGSGSPNLERLPASIAQRCRRPEEFLGAGDWELIAGRIGSELILCGKKHQVAVADSEAKAAILANASH